MGDTDFFMSIGFVNNTKMEQSLIAFYMQPIWGVEVNYFLILLLIIGAPKIVDYSKYFLHT